MVKTNKTAIRKRRPGGGRKPKGPIGAKSEVFTTRITAETRAAIEAEANRSGQSISQVAERLLVLGMETRRQRQNNRSIRAICFLIEKLAGSIGGARFIDINHVDPAKRDLMAIVLERWRTDPFYYKAFTIATQSLLEALKPEGEIKSPASSPELLAAWEKYSDGHLQLMKNTHASPESLAAYTFANLWDALHFPVSGSGAYLEIAKRVGWIGEIMREELYGMQDARNDLTLDLKGDK